MKSAGRKKIAEICRVSLCQFLLTVCFAILFSCGKSPAFTDEADAAFPEIVFKDVIVTNDRQIPDITKIISADTEISDVSLKYTGVPFRLEPGEHYYSVEAVFAGKTEILSGVNIKVLSIDELPVFDHDCTDDELKEGLTFVYKDLADKAVQIDRSVFGKIGICFDNGDLLLEITVKTADMTPPTALLRPVDAPVGASVTPDDFIILTEDFGEVSYSFVSDVSFDVPGEFEPQIRFTDESGNTSVYTASLRLYALKEFPVFEKGGTSDELLDVLVEQTELFPLSLDPDTDVSKFECGNCSVFLFGEYGSFEVPFVTVDTLPPYFSLAPVLKVVGYTPSANDFFRYCYDASSYTARCEFSEEVTGPGEYEVIIVAEDEYGNVSDGMTTLTLILDNDPPEIFGTTDFYTVEGKPVDFMAGVYAVDLIEGAAAVYCDQSNVDLTKEGEYELIYYSTDGSGNVSRVFRKVYVRKPVYVKLDVQNKLQKPDLPNGCEIVSLSIVLDYLGFDNDPVALSDGYLPKTTDKRADPRYEYIGDPKKSGYGCYAPCIVSAANAYLSDTGSEKRAYDVSGGSFRDLTGYIDSGIPVIVWGTVGMKGRGYALLTSNSGISWYIHSHCLVLIGYTEEEYIFADPLEGIVSYAMDRVNNSYISEYSQACVIK